jgi:hypothetical protein
MMLEAWPNGTPIDLNDYLQKPKTWIQLLPDHAEKLLHLGLSVTEKEIKASLSSNFPMNQHLWQQLI